jgi:carbon storage regulator
LLVLSRRVGESIMIGPDVVVTVLEVRPDLVRIGIDAPRDVEVHREEVFVEVQQANRSAASPAPQDVEALAAGMRDDPKRKKNPDDDTATRPPRRGNPG